MGVRRNELARSARFSKVIRRDEGRRSGSRRSPRASRWWQPPGAAQKPRLGVVATLTLVVAILCAAVGVRKAEASCALALPSNGTAFGGEPDPVLSVNLSRTAGSDSVWSSLVIVLDRVSGTADPAAPHTCLLDAAFVPVENASVAFGLAVDGLSASPACDAGGSTSGAVVDGAVYSLTVAINGSTTCAARTGLIADLATEAPVVTDPVDDEVIGNTFLVEFEIPETPSADTPVLVHFRDDGSGVAAGGDHTLELDATGVEAEGIHSVLINGHDLVASTGVGSVLTGSGSLVHDAAYDLVVEYSDALGNAAGVSAEVSGLVFDGETVVPDLLLPRDEPSGSVCTAALEPGLNLTFVLPEESEFGAQLVIVSNLDGNQVAHTLVMAAALLSGRHSFLLDTADFSATDGVTWVSSEPDDAAEAGMSRGETAQSYTLELTLSYSDYHGNAAAAATATICRVLPPLDGSGSGEAGSAFLAFLETYWGVLLGGAILIGFCIITACVVTKIKKRAKVHPEGSSASDDALALARSDPEFRAKRRSEMIHAFSPRRVSTNDGTVSFGKNVEHFAPAPTVAARGRTAAKQPARRISRKISLDSSLDRRGPSADHEVVVWKGRSSSSSAFTSAA